jgi:hypothetical protein
MFSVVISLGAGRLLFLIVAIAKLFSSSTPAEGRQWVKVKVKFALEQARKAHRGSRRIVLLFL